MARAEAQPFNSKKIASNGLHVLGLTLVPNIGGTNESLTYPLYHLYDY